RQTMATAFLHQRRGSLSRHLNRDVRGSNRRAAAIIGGKPRRLLKPQESLTPGCKRRLAVLRRKPDQIIPIGTGRRQRWIVAAPRVAASSTTSSSGPSSSSTTCSV